MKKENAEANIIKDLQREIADLKKSGSSKSGSNSDQGEWHAKKAPVKFDIADTIQDLRYIKKGETVTH